MATSSKDLTFLKELYPACMLAPGMALERARRFNPQYDDGKGDCEDGLSQKREGTSRGKSVAKKCTKAQTVDV